MSSELRALPSVNDLLLQVEDLLLCEGRNRLLQSARQTLDAARDAIKAGGRAPNLDTLVQALRARLGRLGATRPGGRVINASGVVLHTNLGRAPMSDAAQQAMLVAAGDYSPLEFDLESGERGRRGAEVEALLREITECESALVVNNCAAATMLMLAALARGHGVAIARGQLVEIGGGFRVPEIMQQSGAQLLEVGTTNRVRLSDYETALASDGCCGALVVHPSNFKMLGFVEEVALPALSAIVKRPAAWLMHDLGSGALVDTARYGLSHEPMVQESIEAGVDVVCFSGDKLLGGPQAGILAGKAETLARIRKHPLARAMRADKTTLAALAATLGHFARGEHERAIPVLRMLATPLDVLQQRAAALAVALGPWAAGRGLSLACIAGESTVGGGSLPGETLPTALLSIDGSRASDLAAELRAQRTPVIARIHDGRVLLDPRTVLDDAALMDALANC